MTVPFLDVGAGYRELRAELDAAVGRVLGSGRYIGGDEVEVFEREFASFCGSDHAVGVGNGLDALTIALRAHDVGPGDEVIVPAHTFVATWLAVSRVGATPVPVDVEPVRLLIDPGAAEAAIGSRTVAVVPVHLYGQPVDIGALEALVSARGLLVVGDAAQAHGARSAGRDVGALGAAAAFSFYPAKNLGAFGDGGAITTAGGMLAERCRRLRNYGALDHYRFGERGLNSRLDPLQAAVLRVKLAHLEDWNERRRRVARAYLEGLAGVGGELMLPVPAGPGAEAVWHVFCVRHPRRTALAAHLARAGIATGIHYPEPPHRSAAYADLRIPAGAFPVTEQAAATLLSLPIGPHLSEQAVVEVIDAVRSFSEL